MKARIKIFFLFLLNIAGFYSIGQGQQLVVNDSIGFSVTLPDSWHYDSLSMNRDSFIAFSADSTVTYRTARMVMKDGKNSLDYLTYLETLLADMGFTANYVEEKNLFTVLEESNQFHAEDVAQGVYLFEKESKYYAEMISVFHKGNNIYVTITILPVDQSAAYTEQLEVIHSSFQIIR